MTDQRVEPESALPAFASGLCAARNRRYLLIAAILASALGFIDGTVVAIALPAMRETLGASLGQAQWISNAYMLALSALILTGGALGDRFGTARVFGGGILLFMVASALCGLAPTPATLIAARVLQGIGAALMVPGSLALIARAYPPEERGRAIGIWAAASAITTAAGPILGGLLLSFGPPEAWRAIFLVNLPLGAIALWLLYTRVEADKVADASAPFDVAGVLLITGALGAIALALTAAEHGGTPDARDLLIGALGLVLLAAFLLVERRSRAPMLPLGLFAAPGFSAANAVTFVLYFSLSTILFFLPMAVIGGWGLEPLAASAVMVPISVLIGVFSPRVGRLADRTGPRPWIAGGCALVALGYGAMALAAPAQAYWSGIIPGAVIMGAGMTLVVAPLSAMVMASAGPAQSGIASGINNAVSRVAGLVAVAGMGPIAASIYAATNGPSSFGALSTAPGHAEASGIALGTLAGLAALLAAAAAALCLVALPRGVPR